VEPLEIQNKRYLKNTYIFRACWHAISGWFHPALQLFRLYGNIITEVPFNN
jgi:hypothetical protein